MSLPSFFLTAATRAKLPKRRSPTVISSRDAFCFIQSFVVGSARCYATHHEPSSNQPESHRPHTARRTLLHRTYLSLIRATPLLILFQHNNLRGNEFIALRRDLATVMANVDAQLAASKPASTPGEGEGNGVKKPSKSIGQQVKISILNKEVFAAALRVAEYLPTDGKLKTSSGKEAYDLTIAQKKQHPLSPLLVGPVGAIEFPTVSPAHLIAAINLLFPERQTFKKGTDPMFISGVGKMLLLGAKIDKVGGQTIDSEMLKYIGSMGDIDTLRGQLIGVIQGASAGLVGMLQAPTRALWMMVEGRRLMLDEENKPKTEEATPATPSE